MLQAVTLAVASDDATHLPERHFIQELTTAQTYLANEQLVQIVGG
jgi:hypothetical protein